jgi:hypothetical protein
VSTAPEVVEAQREVDRVYAFCLSGLGHSNVQVDPPDPSVGIFNAAVWCEDCGTDLSGDELINPVDRSL